MRVPDTRLLLAFLPYSIIKKHEFMIFRGAYTSLKSSNANISLAVTRLPFLLYFLVNNDGEAR